MMRKLSLGTILLCFTGMVTAILDTVLQLNFLPSADWASGMGWPVFFACLLVGAVAIHVLFRHDAATTGSPFKYAKPHEMALYALGLPVFIAFGLSLFVFNTVPALHALLLRDTVTHIYVIADDYPSGTRHCRRALRLERMPFMHDGICRTPRDFFRQIEKGDRVAVTGLGSSLGVFPGRIRGLGP